MALPIQKRLEKLSKRRELVDHDYAKLKEDARPLIVEARQAGIEANEMAALTGWSRAWLYREFQDEMRKSEPVAD